MTRWLHLMNGLLLAALVGGSLLVYPDLPDSIPRHFGADGSADRWGSRSLLSWMMLPMIAVATAGMMIVIGVILPTRPKLINMPNKDRLLQLPDYLQRWVLEGVAASLHAMTFVTLAMFAIFQYGAWRTAMSGDGEGAIISGVIFALVVMPFLAIGLMIVMQKRMDAAWKQHRAQMTDAVA